MQLLGDVLKKASQFLEQKGVSEPRLSAEWLLATMLDMNRVDLYMNFDRPLNENELGVYRTRISRRVKHEPISYIIGRHSFYGLDLTVAPSVLIPRHETEELVELVIKKLNLSAQLRILDLCTGSGAIACALKSKLVSSEIHASDISEDALSVARKNAQELKLDIEFHLSDLVSGINQKFDVIVCNPPYVARKDESLLHKQVSEYEPHLALFGGEDGLEIYRKLRSGLSSILNNQAIVFFEIGYDQADEVVSMFSSAPFYNPYCLKDSNNQNRFVIVEYKV